MDATQFEHFVANATADGVVFYHSGPLDQARVAGIGGVLRRRLREEGANGAQARKVFAAFMEMAQNIVHYGTPDPAGCGRFGALSVVRENPGFAVMCGNYLPSAHVPRVRAWLEEVQGMSPEHARQAYHRKLSSGGQDDEYSKGAGLGLLTMAVNAAAPIEFVFVPQPPGHGDMNFLFLKAVI
jgi:hypothetical protein